MQAGYFATSWADIKHSEGWFGKLCLLGLLFLIPIAGPILGTIALYGYAYGWARDIAWGVHQPLPARIFANEDGKFWRRGGFVFLLALVLGLIPNVVSEIYSAATGTGYLALMQDPEAFFAASAALGAGSSIVNLIVIALGLAVNVWVWIGAMRISIYDRLSAGFQVGKVWAMFRRDAGGIGRILLMDIVVGLVFGAVIGAVFSVAIVGVVFGSAASLAAVSSGDAAQIAAALGPQVGILLVLVTLLAYVLFVFTAFVTVLVARAMGYWTRQFDVAQWRGQDDPLPFEAPAAWQAPAQAYAAPAADAPSYAQPFAAEPVAAPAQEAAAAAAPASVEALAAEPAEAAAVPAEPGADPVAPLSGEPAAIASEDAASEPSVEPAAVEPAAAVAEQAAAAPPAEPAADRLAALPPEVRAAIAAKQAASDGPDAD